jgi:hypothetical protein
MHASAPGGTASAIRFMEIGFVRKISSAMNHAEGWKVPDIQTQILA